MNIKMSAYILALALRVEAALMIPPLCIALCDNDRGAALGFFLTIFVLTLIGFLIRRPADTVMQVGGAFRLVALVWVVISVFGSLPFVISGEIPGFVDAFFETVSGMTTTGATILGDVEALSRGLLFWRSFTHWIGGMGVLVFVLILLSGSDGHMLYLIRAESTGPEIGKMVPKIADNAKILYLMYLGLTILEVIFLLAGGMPLFDSLINSFGTAGTGGFSNRNLSIGAYGSPYFEWVIGLFMLLFGVNFNIYYCLLMRRLGIIKKNTELKVYGLIVLSATVMITLNIYQTVFADAGEALRQSFFQVSSIITTTGYSSTNFDSWPDFSRILLLILMITGACAGSTAGGAKVVRVVIFIKSAMRQVARFLHPKLVRPVRIDGRPVEDETISAVSAFFAVYFILIAAITAIVAAFGYDMITAFSATMTTVNNVGPGLALVGPLGNFGPFNPFLKLLFSFAMLAGRLEIFPMLLLLVWPVGGMKRRRVKNGEE